MDISKATALYTAEKPTVGQLIHGQLENNLIGATFMVSDIKVIEGKTYVLGNGRVLELVHPSVKQIDWEIAVDHGLPIYEYFGRTHEPFPALPEGWSLTAKMIAEGPWYGVYVVPTILANRERWLAGHKNFDQIHHSGV